MSADIQDAIETAVGGKAVSQVLQGEQRYDLVVRYQPQYRAPWKQSSTFAFWRHPANAFRLDQVCDIRMRDGASQIYRENN